METIAAMMRPIVLYLFFIYCIEYYRRADLCLAASREMRRKVASTLLPRLLSFTPDLLFISAGFDAHYDDLYHFLDEADFHWLTEQLCSTVEPHGGKVISVCTNCLLLLLTYCII